MYIDNDYVEHLEELITVKLLPIYQAYYKLISQPEPKLNISAINKRKKKQTARLLQKPERGVGVDHVRPEGKKKLNDL